MSKKVKRLYEGFQPHNYRLELHPDRDTMQLTGTVVITGKKAGRPSQRLTFHQKGLKVTEARITKHDKKGDQDFTPSRISLHKSYDEVRLHTAETLHAGNYTVTMRFSAQITDSMHGVYPCYYEIDGKKQALIATQFESHHAREAFPCIDEPEAKATFDLTLISPKDEVVLANTLVASQDVRDGKYTTIFETTPVMSTYLLAFVYGDLQSKEATTKDGVAVRLWATKAHAPASLDFGLDVAQRSIEFFNEYFDTPYPLAKADHIALPDFSSGAMENWGLITYRESCLLADPDTTSQSTRETVAMVIAHETSHQWFGNLVTMRWWDNLWLNESFANVMEYVATDAMFPEWDVWNSFITMEGLPALRRDAIAGVQAVQTDVSHPDEISSLFDPSIVYAKGGRLLKMLMEYVGEDDFRKGLKHYFTTHAYGNTTGDDLWTALSGASGKDVAAFMNPWIMRAGYPVVSVDQQKDQLKLTQEHFLLNPEKTDASLVWPVPLLADRKDVPALLDEPQALAVLTSSEYVRVNQGASGHYIARYVQSEHAAAIASQVENKILGDAERLMLLNDSSMLARSGELSFAETLRLLEKYADEDREPVWDIMALILGEARRFIDVDASLESPVKSMIRTLVHKQFERLGWDEQPDEAVQDTKLRATITSLGIYAKDSTIVEGALKLFGKYQSDPAAVPSELRAIVFGAAVRTQAPGAFEYLIKLEESTSNVDLKYDIASALTMAQQAEEIQTLLDRLQDSDKVRPQDIVRWISYMLRNRYTRKDTWKWLRDKWSWIEKTFEGDKSYDYFPRIAASTFNTRRLLEEYKTFFSPLKEDIALTRNIVMGIEELESRIKWLERDHADVKAYFA